MTIYAINWSGNTRPVREVTPKKEAETVDNKPVTEDSSVGTGVLLTALTVLAAGGIYIASRGKSKAAQKMITGALDGVKDNAGKIAKDVIKTDATKVSREIPDVATVIAEPLKHGESRFFQNVPILTPHSSRRAGHSLFESSFDPAFIHPEPAKLTPQAKGRAIDVVSDISPKGTATPKVKPVTENVSPKSVNATKGTENVVSSTEQKVKFGESGAKVEKAEDEIRSEFKKPFASETEEVASKRKGTFGQDLDDPLDPRNADDIMSPHYKQKGAYGQDPLSPYYETTPPYSMGMGTGTGFDEMEDLAMASLCGLI